MATERTWYTRAEVPIADFTTGTLQAKSVSWGFKALLMQQITTGTLGPTGAPPGSAAWTCDHSCDSVTAGTPGDGIDRWGSTFDESKVVHSQGSARSWFVLKSPARTGGVHFYIMISLGHFTQTAPGYWDLKFSKNAFTGGTTTAQPTSTNSVDMGTSLQIAINEPLDHRLGYSTSADGSFHFMTNKVGAGIFNCYVGGWSLNDSNSNDLHDFWMAQQCSDAGLGAPGSALPTPKGRTPTDTGVGVIFWTLNASLFSAPANWDTGKAGAIKVFLANYSGPGGVRGSIPDMLQGAFQKAGKAIPSVAAPEYITSSGWLIPWGVASKL